MALHDHIMCSEAVLDPEAEHRALRSGGMGDGALVSFTGIARPGSGADADTSDPVITLRLQHYPGFTEQSIARGVAQARSRWPIQACHIAHRVGDIRPGEVIVFVATTARHRRAAFEATDFLTDWLKTDAAFWKCEITANGAQWIEPRDQDHHDRRRWDELYKRADTWLTS